MCARHKAFTSIIAGLLIHDYVIMLSSPTSKVNQTCLTGMPFHVLCAYGMTFPMSCSLNVINENFVTTLTPISIINDLSSFTSHHVFMRGTFYNFLLFHFYTVISLRVITSFYFCCVIPNSVFGFL